MVNSARPLNPLNLDENIESETIYDTDRNRSNVKKKGVNNVQLTTQTQDENIDVSDISFENNPLDSSDKKQNKLFQGESLKKKKEKYQHLQISDRQKMIPDNYFYQKQSVDFLNDTHGIKIHTPKNFTLGKKELKDQFHTLNTENMIFTDRHQNLNDFAPMMTKQTYEQSVKEPTCTVSESVPMDSEGVVQSDSSGQKDGKPPIN